jgi:hypothetical protein
MKRTKKTPNDAKPTIEGVLDASIATLHLGITELRAEIELIAAGKGAKSKHDKGSRIAFLTARVGSIADSLRKVEAARAKRLDDLTPAMVLAWLRSLDASERAQFLREALRIDEARSGLA